jgi:hypothetical protein
MPKSKLEGARCLIVIGTEGGRCAEVVPAHGKVKRRRQAVAVQQLAECDARDRNSLHRGGHKCDSPTCGYQAYYWLRVSVGISGAAMMV